MTGIAIIGTGISGIHLALYLQSRGIDSTLYSPTSVDEQRSGRLPNCVMRWAPTVDRERDLQVFHWEENDVEAVHVSVVADPPIAFTGRLPRPANTTDFRMYLPALIEDYIARGGRLVVCPCGPEQLLGIAERHDLVVVAAGRDGFGGIFPRDEARSPNDSPRRHITAGLYHGVGWPEPAGVEFSIYPGVGEVFQVCFHSFDGPVSAVAMEGIPGSPLAELVEIDYSEDPSGFERRALELLETFAPSIRERVIASEFGLTRPIDVLQGRLTPVVRRPWASLDGDRFAIAIGDAWILNDPIAAQGANLGSRCAFVLGDAIARAPTYDMTFCKEIERDLWAVAEAPTILSNALLEPPPDHVVATLVRASRDHQVADRFANGFGEPETLLKMLTPEPAYS